MAVDTVGTAQIAGSNTAGTTATATVATGLVVGNLALIAVTQQATGGTMSTPAGWTVAGTAANGANFFSRLFWKFYASGDPATVAFTILSSAWSCVSFGCSGHDPANPITAGTNTANASALTHNIAAMTAATNGGMGVALEAIGSASTTFSAYPATFPTNMHESTAGKRTSLRVAKNLAAGQTLAASTYTLSANALGASMPFEIRAEIPGYIHARGPNYRR